MQKWEYKFLTIAYSDAFNGVGLVKYVNGEELPGWKKRKWKADQALNELGKDGWELVDTIWRIDTNILWDSVYILKRPIE